MKNIHKELHGIQVARGLDENSPVNVEVDCRYNNPVQSGSSANTPYQPGTQVTYLDCS